MSYILCSSAQDIARQNLIWHLCNECERQVFLSQKCILKHHFHHNEWQNWGASSLPPLLFLPPSFCLPLYLSIYLCSTSLFPRVKLRTKLSLVFVLNISICCSTSATWVKSILVGKGVLPFHTHSWTHKWADRRSICCSVEWVKGGWHFSLIFCTDKHIIELITN